MRRSGGKENLHFVYPAGMLPRDVFQTRWKILVIPRNIVLGLFRLWGHTWEKFTTSKCLLAVARQVALGIIVARKHILLPRYSRGQENKKVSRHRDRFGLA